MTNLIETTDKLSIAVELYRDWGLKVSLFVGEEEVSSDIINLHDLKQVLDRMED